MELRVYAASIKQHGGISFSGAQFTSGICPRAGSQVASALDFVNASGFRRPLQCNIVRDSQCVDGRNLRQSRKATPAASNAQVEGSGTAPTVIGVFGSLS